MRYETTLPALGFAALMVVIGFTQPVQAGTCQPVPARGVAKDLKTATLYAQADLKQTAKTMKGKVTQTSTNCVPGPSNYKCKIDAVVCPK